MLRATGLLPERAYRWNFAMMGLDLGLFIVALSFTSVYGVMPLFIQHLTHSNLALGLITTIRAIGSSLPPILAAPMTERLDRKKAFLLILTTFERLPYLALALLIPILAGAHDTLLLWVFFAMIGIGTWFGGMGFPAWLDLIARMMPSDWRGRFFGVSGAIGGLLGVPAAAAAAFLLERFAWPTNFAVCFGCTSVCLAISFIFIASGREPEPDVSRETRARRTPTQWRHLPALLRADPNFAVYLAATALLSAAGMAVSFYTVDAKDTLHLSDATAGIYAIVLLAASTIGSVGWGYLGDHIGHKRVVEGGALCTGLAALVALLVHSTPIGLVGYALAFVLVGLASSAIQLAAFTFVIDFAPEEKRPTYVGVSSLANVPFTAGAPLVAGVIADHAGYPAVFACTVVLSFAAALLVWKRVIDPRMAGEALLEAS